MDKLQKTKTDLEQELKILESEKTNQDQPIDLDDFQEFTKNLKDIVANESRPEAIAAIIRRLINKIEITDEGAIVHFHVGENHFTREFNSVITPRTLERPRAKYLEKYNIENNFYDAGSNRLIIGLRSGI